ncbi:GSH-induced LITAF domain protein-like [Zingiber officinale]|uniref:GSH-induced LITAF domain protein-like n=1 Tax=Zingiber officinale TaxID=94328 RepID=UPI001C4A797A|nr:GSH-induced LITAF domain protein-like [Zingiber officinale]
MATKGKEEDPALGVPYGYAYGPPPSQPPPPPPPPPQVYYVGQNPYQAGMIPPNAVYGDPKGIPLQQTMFRDTPAPFQCVYCGSSGLTTIRSKPSLAAAVGCMMPFMLGVCFLCPSMDCLWHKYHYCPSCGQKVADFEKSDPCLVMDPPSWREPSFAVPA